MNYSFASYVPIEITSRCNLKCRHCYGEFPRSGDSEMTTTQVKELILELYKLGVFQIEIGGGEPSLRDDFFEILEYASKFNDIDVLVVTNGILFNDDLLYKISSLGKKIKFHISMDGYDPDSYSFLRNNKTGFYKALHTTKYMIENNIPVTWNVAVGKVTASYLPKIIDLAKEIGLKNIRLMILYDNGRSSKNRLGFSFKEYQNFLERFMRDEFNDCGVRISISFSQPFEYFIPLMELGYSKNEIVNKLGSLGDSCMCDPVYRSMTNLSCTGGRNKGSVDTNGNFHFCCMLTNHLEYAGGNIFCSSLKDIWDNSEAFEWIRSIRLEDLNTTCYKCKYKDLCGGGCRARALYATGDFLGCDPLCPLVKPERKNTQLLIPFVSSHKNNNNSKIKLSNLKKHNLSMIINNTNLRIRIEEFGASIYNEKGNSYVVNKDGLELLKYMNEFQSPEKVVEYLSSKKNINSKISVEFINDFGYQITK